jgi:hypothetical protein
MIGRAGISTIATVVAASLLVTTPAQALSPIERQRLARGESIVAEATHRHNGGRLVGGLSYRILDADADRISALFRDPKQWSQILPRVRSVELLSIDKNGRARVRVTHALGMFSGSYEIILAFTDHGHYGRFWVNKSVENDLLDGWGFLRLTPLPNHQTLVTWGVLFDVGDGVTRTLFEAKMQRAALDVPRRLSNLAHVAAAS